MYPYYPNQFVYGPLSFDEWCQRVNIEDKYNAFHDEYGDATGCLWDFKQVHYDDYLSDFKRDLTFHILDDDELAHLLKKFKLDEI